jgi:hypothetical protein
LPLKDVDLKTFEAYKKAVRLDLPKITTGTKFWIYKDVELPNSAGKKQKIASFIALVDDKAIKPLLKGKTLICKGNCGMEDGKVAFEAESGKVPYRLLKTSVPLFLGKMVHIPANAEEDGEGVESGESESEDETSSTQSTPSGQSTPDGQGLAAAWNKLLKDMQTAVTTHPERKDALAKAAAGVPDLIKANKVDEARQKMEALEQMLKSAPPQTQTQPGTGLAATWNKLVKDLQQAVAAHPEKKDALSRAAAGVPDLIKANKTEEAMQKMDALQKLLDAPSGGPSSTAPSGAAELTARWNGLVKQMQAAAAAHPEKKADIVRASAGIPDMIRVGKADLAKKLMDGVDTVLKGLVSNVDPNAAPKVDPREKQYRDRYAALEGELAEALKDPAQDAGRLRAVSAFAIEKAEAGDYEAALKALTQLEQVLGTAPKTQEPESETTEQESEDGPGKTEFARRYAELDERVLLALRAGVGDVSQIRSVSGFASDKAEAGDYAAALKALDRLVKLLDEADEDGDKEEGAPYPGLVKYRGALLQFAKAKDQVSKQIAALKNAIPATLPEEAEIANELADELASWNEDLSAVVDEAMNTAEDEDSPVTAEIRTQIQKYLDDLSTDELIQHVEKNTFGVSVSIAATLGGALKKIQQSMPA